MAIAGRVAIVPKGEYSNAVTYDKLDLVMFNNDAYVAKKASTGIEPTNNEYWMLILNNVVAEDLEKIIDGTTPVGNALQLGGKSAGEYVSIDDFIGGSKVSVGVAENKSLDMLYFEFSDGTRKLLKYDNTTKRLALTEFDGSIWSGNDIAYTVDLANYVNRMTGDTIYGTVNLYKENSDIALGVHNSVHDINLVTTSYGLAGLYSPTLQKWILEASTNGAITVNGTATGNLPLSGGKITGALQLQNPESDNSYIQYQGVSGRLGYLGFSGVDNPVIVNASATSLRKLLHEGNSAKVAIQESAPSDTTSLWVDTANKVTKAYIDGAWTQVA